MNRSMSSQFLRDMFAAAGILAIGSAEHSARAADPSSPPPYPGAAEPPPQEHFQQFKPKLRVTKLETVLVKPRWLFLKLHTDAGIVGLGEPILEGRPLTCAAAVQEVAPYPVGKDPRAVVHHWQAIYR